MSTGTGTIQAGRKGMGFVTAAAFALMIAIVVAVFATSLASRPDRAPADRTERPAAVAVVSGTAANTPTEIRGGRIGEAPTTVYATGNTPTELSGGLTAIGQARADHQRN